MTELKIDILMYSFIFKRTSAPHRPMPHTTEFIAGAGLQRPSVDGKTPQPNKKHIHNYNCLYS